VNQAIIELVVA